MGQIEEIVRSQLTTRQCLVATILHQHETESSASTESSKCENLEKVVTSDDLEKFFQIEVQLPPREKEELIEFFRRHIDVFAWNAYKAPGVDPSFICHHLNVNPSVTPKK